MLRGRSQSGAWLSAHPGDTYTLMEIDKQESKQCINCYNLSKCESNVVIFHPLKKYNYEYDVHTYFVICFVYVHICVIMPLWLKVIGVMFLTFIFLR